MLKKIKSKENAKKLVKFFWLWLSIYWINLWLTIVLIEILNIPINIAYIISMSFIIIYSFIASFKFIFKTDFSYVLLLKYLVALFSFSIFNYFITISLKNLFWKDYLYIIIIIITTLLSIIKFFIYNRFIFITNKKW